MSTPTRLYKYQPFSAQTLANLQKRQIWFSKPVQFNDPFDCQMKPRIGEASEADYWRMFEDRCARKERAPAFRARYSKSGRVTQEFKDSIHQALTSGFEKHIAEFSTTAGVSCFSEVADDLLLWAHYGDGHRGFCLEFDTSFLPRDKVHPVKYVDSMPVFSPVDLLMNNDAPVMDVFTTKASCWKYEREWRVFHAQGNFPFVYDWRYLTGVYFGVGMEYAHKEIIALILHGSPTKLHQLVRSEASFKLSHEVGSYTPFDYARPETSDETKAS